MKKQMQISICEKLTEINRTTDEKWNKDKNLSNEELSKVRSKYLEIHKLIEKKIKEAKAHICPKKCEEMYDYHNMYKKIREFMPRCKKQIIAE